MMKISPIVTLVCAFAAAAQGGVKEVDTRTDRLKPATHSIVFMARSGIPGHAYVAWSVDSPGEQMCIVKAFGFYPASVGKGLVGPVPGAVVDETLKGGMTRGEPLLIVRVTPERYREAEAIRRRWASKPFQLTQNDCLSMSQEIARALGLKLPERDRTTLPFDYIRRLANLN